MTNNVSKAAREILSEINIIMHRNSMPDSTRDKIEAIIQRCVDEALANEWQPIETAPKDGTEVLVYTDVATVPVVHIARWEDGRDGYPDSFEQGWWSYTEHSVTQTLLEDWKQPTHWMPLPPAPTEREGE